MSSALPQVWRLWRSDCASGVSLSSAVLGAVASAAWLVYGALLRDPAQIAANLPSLVGAVLVVALVVSRTGRGAVASAASAVVCAGGLGLLGLHGGAAAVGAGATAVSVTSRVPQAWTVARSRGAGLVALSPASTALSLLSSALWLVYGLGMGQVPVWACSLTGTAFSGVVLARRCPPARVVRALRSGRFGRPGRVLVARVDLVLARG